MSYKNYIYNTNTMNDNTEIKAGFAHTLEGSFKLSVIDAKTNEIIREQSEFQRNLILNDGMNLVATYQYTDLITYCIAGTGTRVNKVQINGGSSTVSQTGTSVVLDPVSPGFTDPLSGYSQVLEVGDVIVFDVGSGGVNDVMVVGPILGNGCTVNKSAIIPSTTFTIWKTSQKFLQNEVKRAGNSFFNGRIVTGIGNQGTVMIGNVITHQRTWDLSPETSLINYTEVGIGYAWDQTFPTFSRLLLPSPFAVDAGQRLRISYKLKITLTPATPVLRPDATITGWTTTHDGVLSTRGSESIQSVYGNGPDAQGIYSYSTMRYIDYAGSTRGASTLEVCNVGQCVFFLSTTATPLAAFNSAIDRSGVASYAGWGDGGTKTTLSTYVPNSFTRTKTAVHGFSGMVRSDIRSIGFGYYDQYNNIGPAAPANQAFCFVFDEPQIKTGNQTLTVTYVWTWDRTYNA